jgi:hypothetical protein
MHALSSYLRQATSSLSRAFSSTSQPAAQTVHAENIPVARGPQRTPLNLKVGDSVHGFQCVSINAYNDMGVQAYKFVHPVFGCEWLHLDTDDVRSITFVFWIQITLTLHSVYLHRLATPSLSHFVLCLPTLPVSRTCWSIRCCAVRIGFPFAIRSSTCCDALCRLLLSPDLHLLS